MPSPEMLGFERVAVRRWVAALVLTGSAFTGFSAWAQGPGPGSGSGPVPGSAAAFALGSTPCTTVVESLRAAAPGAAPEAMQFLAGYSSARYAGTTRSTIAQTDPFFGHTAAQVQKWLVQWCTAQPERKLADAAQRLFDELPGAGPAAAARTATSTLGLQADQVSTCSARTVGACEGCSVVCKAPQQAQCVPGREGRAGTPGLGRCGAPSQCECR